jgi:NACalpha-BTF3-like transcription factor
MGTPANTTANIVPPVLPGCGFVPPPLPLHQRNMQENLLNELGINLESLKTPLRFPTPKRTTCFSTPFASQHTQQQAHQQQTQFANEANGAKEKEAHEKKHKEKEERSPRGALPHIHKHHHHHGMHWKSFSPQINQGFSAL